MNIQSAASEFLAKIPEAVPRPCGDPAVAALSAGIEQGSDFGPVLLAGGSITG